MKNKKGILLVLWLFVFSSCSWEDETPRVNREFLRPLEGNLITIEWCKESNGMYLIPFEGESTEYPINLSESTEINDGQIPIALGSVGMTFDGLKLFGVGVGGNSEDTIYTRNIDQADWEPLIMVPLNVLHVAPSPDNKKIAMAASRDDNQDGKVDGQDQVDIFTLNMGESVPEPVIHNMGDSLFPSWSPDGKFLAYALDTPPDSKGFSGVYVMNLETGEQKRLFDYYETSLGLPISWSPDSRYVAYEDTTAEEYWYGSDIYIFDLTTGETKQLTHTHQYTPYTRFKSGGIRLSRPLWSPDGNYILFKWSFTDWDKNALFVTSSDGTTVSRLSEWSDCYSDPFLWRP